MPKKVILKNINWGKYLFEFLSIFIAVVAAFALNNWNDNRRDSKAESKILIEILQGFEKDIEDAQTNVMGHEVGIKACKYWRKIINNEPVSQDTLARHYLRLTRDFVSIQNTSGYEALKSKGLEIIKNDSLRSKIISLYEFEFKTVLKLEEDYHELQFQRNYFNEFNRIVAPHFQYDQKGNPVGIDLPLKISKADKNIMLSYLWKIEINRGFILVMYAELEETLMALSAEIEKEI